MTIQEINERCQRGEICVADHITLPGGNTYLPDDFIRRYPTLLGDKVFQYDEIADVAWIYDERVRATHEYNPV